MDLGGGGGDGGVLAFMCSQYRGAHCFHTQIPLQHVIYSHSWTNKCQQNWSLSAFNVFGNSLGVRESQDFGIAVEVAILKVETHYKSCIHHADVGATDS